MGVKEPLKGLVIAATGDFGQSRGPESLKKWVEANGGKWATSISRDTTHLICSKEHWKKGAALVTAAKKHQDINIVTYDWLEDSLLQGKRRRERPYMLKTLEKARQKKKKERKAKERNEAKHDAAQFQIGCKHAEEDLKSGTSEPKPKPKSKASSWFSSSLDALHRARAERAAKNDAGLPTPKHLPQPSSSTTADSSGDPLVVKLTDLYHIYQDITGFQHDVTLTRIDIANNRNERYQLRMYESNTVPYMYCVFLRFSQPSKLPLTQMITPLASTFQVAFKAFRDVFHQKTLLSWEERLDRELGKERRTGMSGEPFVYLPPPEGEPRGVIPEMSLKGT